jgi:predicted transcriptional regulator
MNKKINGAGDSQIKELRAAMFDQLKRLIDDNVDLQKEIRRAQAITSVGNVIVNSVKVELDFIRIANQENKHSLDKQLPSGK